MLAWTLTCSGWHTFEIIDGTDSEKTWSKDFKVAGVVFEFVFALRCEVDEISPKKYAPKFSSKVPDLYLFFF